MRFPPDITNEDMVRAAGHMLKFWRLYRNGDRHDWARDQVEKFLYAEATQKAAFGQSLRALHPDHELVALGA